MQRQIQFSFTVTVVALFSVSLCLSKCELGSSTLISSLQETNPSTASLSLTSFLIHFPLSATFSTSIFSLKSLLESIAYQSILLSPGSLTTFFRGESRMMMFIAMLVVSLLDFMVPRRGFSLREVLELDFGR